MGQKNQNGGKRSGRDNGRRERGNRVNARNEQMELLFAEQMFGREKKIICYLGDGTVVYPGTRRFKPKPGQRYLCDVRLVGRDSNVGLARPVLPYILSPEEWVPDSALRQVLVSELVFQEQTKNGEKRLIAFDGGQAVFPDRGTEVTVGKRRAYMLRERGTVSFAIALPEEAKTGGTGLVKLAEKFREWSAADLQHIVLQRAQNKPGIAMARSEKEVEIVSEYRNIYVLLGVSKDASRDEIRKVFKAKSKALHPDMVFQSWKRTNTEPPLLVKMNAQFFFEALTEAHKRAIEVLDRAEEGSKAAEAETRTDASHQDAKAKEQAPKSKRSPRKRKPRKAKKDEQAPKAETSAETTTPAEEVPATEPANEAPETEAVEATTSPEAAVETTPAEPTAKEGPSDRTTEDGDPIGDDGMVYGKYAPDEWAELAPNVKKFARRYGRNTPSTARPAQDEAAPAQASKPRSPKPAPKKLSFHEQLAEQVKNGSKS